jgi:glutamate formiminotransferase
MEVKNEVKNVVKQIYDFQKSALYNTFDTVALMQIQAEQYGAALIEQNPALPPQAKSALSDWVDLQNKARNDYKKILDESFKNLENVFADAAGGK